MTEKTETDAIARAELAYDHAKAMLADQQSTLDSIRERATAAMGLAGLVATILGGGVLTDETDSFGIVEWGAILALIATLICTLWVLWQRKWDFLMDPLKMLSQFSIDEQVDLKTMYTALSVFSHDNYEKNEKKLNQMFIGLNAIFLLVLVQILFWFVSLGEFL